VCLCLLPVFAICGVVPWILFHSVIVDMADNGHPRSSVITRVKIHTHAHRTVVWHLLWLRNFLQCRIMFYCSWGFCVWKIIWAVFGARGLVVRVTGYRSRDPGFVSRRYQIFWEVVGLERGSNGLVSITEKLLEWKSSGSGSRKRD
jgi:hypothetical protein